jgi:hypothetical protein
MKTRSIGSRLIHVLLAVGALAFSVCAQAAYVGSVVFRDPTGTVGPNDTIEIWMRFTLDPSSDPLVLTLDSGANPPFGVPLANIPTNFDFNSYDPNTNSNSYHSGGNFTAVTGVYLNTFFGCTGSFNTSCNDGAYHFDFNTAGPDSINFLPTFDRPDVSIQPGESRDYLFGTFTPVGGGPVAPGIYEFLSTGLTINFTGSAQAKDYVLDENGDLIPVLDEFGQQTYDEFGNPVFVTQLNSYDNVSASVNLAVTECGAEPAAGCKFTREVAAVPAPPAIWLFLTGMAGLAGRAVRRRR